MENELNINKLTTYDDMISHHIKHDNIKTTNTSHATTTQIQYNTIQYRRYVQSNHNNQQSTITQQSHIQSQQSQQHNTKQYTVT